MTIREFEQKNSVCIVNKFDPNNTSFLIDHVGWEKTVADKPESTNIGLFALHFIVRGNLTLFYKNKQYVLSKNTVFLVHPEKSIKYITDPQNPVQYYWYAVSGSSAYQFFKSIGFSDEKIFIPLPELFAKKVRDAFFKALSLSEELRSASHLYMNESFYRIARNIFLSQLNPESFLSIPSSVSQTILDIIAYIQEHFTEPTLTLQSIASKFFMNPDYLSNLFKKELGVNFKNYLTQKRVHYADILIRQGESNVEMLAYKVGFLDASYFTKVYKKINLSTPKKEISKQKQKVTPPPKR